MKTRIIVAATAALLLSFGSIGIASAAFADDAVPIYHLALWSVDAPKDSPHFPQTLVADVVTNSTDIHALDSKATVCGTTYQADLYANVAGTDTLIGSKKLLGAGQGEIWPSTDGKYQSSFSNVWTTADCVVVTPPTPTPTPTPTPAPTVQTCTALGNVKTTGNAEGGLPSPWDTSNTRATGHNMVTGNALHVYTDGATSTDKAAAYYPLAVALANIGTPVINYSASAGTPPGFQIVLSDGRILVGEPAYYGDRFWSKTAETGVPAADGYPASADLNTWLAAMPTAQVAYIGYSLGSGVKGDSTITSLSMGAGCNLTFAAYVAPVVVTPPVAPPLTPVLAETGVNDTVPLIIALSIAVTGMLLVVAGTAYTKRREAIAYNKELDSE